MLGCIPRSSSPPLEISEDSANESEPRRSRSTDETKQEEIRSLRVSCFVDCLGASCWLNTQTRLVLLERNPNVKTETIGRVKREREDDENTSRRQRPRKSAKIETVDLTDDWLLSRLGLANSREQKWNKMWLCSFEKGWIWLVYWAKLFHRNSLALKL